MALYLIAGNAGTGKSELCRVLRGRGYEAHDADDALARWQHTRTGYVHPKSSVKPEQRTEAFLAEHTWNVPRQAAEALAREAAHKTIFLCGALGNVAELHDLFGRVFVLRVDDATLKHRLATRTGNTWGKQPHELLNTLGQQHVLYERHEKWGDTTIDATKTPDEVADAVLSLV